MSVINLTIHSVQVYKPEQFIELEQVKPTTWLADGVEWSPLRDYPSSGYEARIAVSEKVTQEVDGVPCVETTYGEVTGLPQDLDPEATLLVSLPTASMAKSAGHPLASRMVSPKGVVRLRSDTSVILGCMGFTRQPQ